MPSRPVELFPSSPRQNLFHFLRRPPHTFRNLSTVIFALEDPILHFWVVFLNFCLKKGVTAFLHIFFITFSNLGDPIICLFPDLSDGTLFQGLSLRYLPLAEPILASPSVLHEQKLILFFVGDDSPRDRNTTKGLSHIVNDIRLHPQKIRKVLINLLHEVLLLLSLHLVIGK